MSWIELRLVPVGDGRTRLELEHTAHVDDERWVQFGPGAVGVGWDGALLGLAGQVESGKSVDPSEAQAWSASEEGKQFMTLSSQAWAEASIAGGTESGMARAAAERTTAFYTGTSVGVSCRKLEARWHAAAASVGSRRASSSR